MHSAQFSGVDETPIVLSVVAAAFNSFAYKVLQQLDRDTAC
jgi:hypothetical protein